jgi:hypothetical protein
MKKINPLAINWPVWVSLVASLLVENLSAMACEVCKKQQPKLLQGITHGSGPDSKWDYLIVTIMIIITLYVLIAAVKCILRPSERNEQHIKRIILND